MGRVISFGTIHIDTGEIVKMIGGAAGTDNYTTLQIPSGTFYQVPADTKYVMGLILYNGTTVRSKVCIGYGDDTVDDSGTPPTNYVSMHHMMPVEVSDKLYQIPVYIEIPEGKYPLIHAWDGGAECNIIGVETPV